MKLSILLTLLVMALIGAGCDGAGEEELTLEEYFARFNSIMAETDATTDALLDEARSAAKAENRSDDEIIDSFREAMAPIVEAVQRLSKDVDALDPPVEVEDTHRRLVDSFADEARVFDEWYRTKRFEDFVLTWVHAESFEDTQAMRGLGMGEPMRVAEDAQEAACDELSAVADANGIEFGGC